MRASARRRPIASLFVCTVAALLFLRGPVAADSLLLARFTDYLESLRAQSAIPGLAAAIIGTNDIIWERGFGFQDLERSVVTRTDTPFQIDGLSQVFMATLVLRCVEDGQLSLDDRVGQYNADSPDSGATLRQLLTYTSGPPDNLAFTYRPDRLDSLAAALAACKNLSFREFISTFFDRLAMRASVPGPDVLASPPTATGWPDGAALARYSAVLDRLATPYVTSGKSVRRSTYTATTLTPASGVISTVDDFAQFDLALKNGLLLRSDTIAQAWQTPVNRSGQRLPHGIGWFVQGYHGELVVWQFGISDAGSSSLVLEVPGRGVTFVLLANSSALVKPYPLAAGDVTVSPFARLFLGLVVP